jgi:hypothetical protein
MTYLMKMACCFYFETILNICEAELTHIFDILTDKYDEWYDSEDGRSLATLIIALVVALAMKGFMTVF